MCAVLITFDASMTSDEVLMKEVRSLLEISENMPGAPAKPGNSRRSSKKVNDLLVHSIIDITGHILMPKPFGLLFPLAV